MSVQDAPEHTVLPLAKPKPEIPPKPSSQAISSPEVEDKSSTLPPSDGKVKRIVNKFSKKEDAPIEVKEKKADGGSGLSTSNRLKRLPVVKPKPGRASLQLLPLGEQAPPLPMKRSNILRRQAEREGETEDGSLAEGGRSEPDGKEFEIPSMVGGEATVDVSPQTPLSPCCDPGCCCICHLQRPGMKLVWVPVEVEDGGDEVEVTELDGTDEEDDSLGNEEEEEGHQTDPGAGDEVDRNPDDMLQLTQDKAKFVHSLGVLIGEGHRRRSDPGPHTVLASLAVTRSQSPPVPPKQSQLVQQKLAGSAEESIYELTLPVAASKSESSCKELDIPLIRVRKPARRSKLSYSTSDPTSEFQNEEDHPPAIPPRVPLSHDSLASGHSTGLPLPQPTLNELHPLRPSSPNNICSQRALTPPTGSPMVPHRAPPPPPKSDSRRLSSASMQSIISKKEGDAEEEKEETNSEPGDATFSWESRLQDEPLYQTYSATVITKEIRRQTVFRNISKTSVDYPADWTARQSGTGAATSAPAENGGRRGSLVPPPAQNTLWQDLPTVRDSGVLDQLTPDQCKYQESMFEVLTSEASYLRSLRVLTEHFLENRDLEETLIMMDRKPLFSNILRIREVSERFLKDLDDRIFERPVFSDICDIIHYHAQHNFPAYIDYVRNQTYQEKKYSTLMKENVQFAAVISRLQESPQCQRLPFMSFLLLPFQRITRIKMLTENILKRTKAGTKEEQMPAKALDSMSKIIDECNSEVGKMKRMEELVHVSQSLEFDRLKAIPIISPTRYLEKRGELQEMSKGATIFNMRAKFSSVFLFLFNDLLIITTKKGAERFVVQDHAHRSLVQVQPFEGAGSGTGPYLHCFNLTLLENHQGRMMERLLKAPSQSDMHRWMAAFPNPTNPDGGDDEVIYEDWDCPQVQCVEQYVAQQADELTLEPTEIVNVIRKANEGWYEGIRLSDGQKGWFPVCNVIEITNEHVRRRNLRERYRVIQAASVVTNNKTRSTN
ncbi:rho guanine nucleotide exchange factor 19 [Neosynchiropus ocellatus]